MEIDREVAEEAMARGLTAEFGAHTDRWVEEREAGSLLDGWLRDEGQAVARYKVMVDTWGPIAVEESTASPEWERAESVNVVPEMFGADFVQASLEAQQLLATPVEGIDKQERHRILQQTCRAKFKLVFALLTTMRSPALRSIMREILESPGAGAMTLVAGNYLMRSKEGFLRWFFSSFGIRLDQSHLDQSHLDQGHLDQGDLDAGHPGGISSEDQPRELDSYTSVDGKPEPLRFRFDPSISTTQIMIGEVAVVRNEQRPSSVQDWWLWRAATRMTRRSASKLALLGWKRDQPIGRLLSNTGERWRFAPDGKSFTRESGTELWLLQPDSNEWITKVEGGPWVAGTWLGNDSSGYVALRKDQTRVDFLDLTTRPLGVTTRKIKRVRGEVAAIAVSPDQSLSPLRPLRVRRPSRSTI